MRKTIIVVTVAVVLLTIAVAVVSCLKMGEIGTFSLEESCWHDKIERYTDNTEFVQEVEERVSNCEFALPITTADEAIDAALQVWFPIYGEESIVRQRPYNAFYDASSEMWLIYGTLHSDLGGTAGILIQTDGTIVAVWHER